MNRTRILLIIGFILIALSLLVIIYYLFFRPAISPTGTVNGGPPGTLPGVGNGNVNRILPNLNGGVPGVNGQPGVGQQPGEIAASDRPTIVRPLPTLPSVGPNWTLGPDRSGIQFYDRDKGQFFRSSPDGTRRNLLVNTFYPDVQGITWSPDGSKAVLEFPDKSKVVVDFPNATQATLPKESEGFSFSPDSARLAFKFIGANPDDRFLVTTATDGSDARQIEKLGENDAFVTPNWSPDNTVVATFQKAVGNGTEIFFIGQHGENFKSLPVDGRNFRGTWSPDGANLLFSIVSPLNSNNPELFIVDARGDTIGQNLLDLGITASADKCTFSRVSVSTVYCAVPDHLEPDSGLFPGLTPNETDRLYRIDLTSGQQTLLADPVDESGRVQFNASQLNLSAAEDALYFTDAATGKIYTVKLR
jgi:hypothetical protein